MQTVEKLIAHRIQKSDQGVAYVMNGFQNNRVNK